MLIAVLRQIFERDLNKLYNEINAYAHEEKLWHTDKGITNSAGNLCLHLVGNLNTYIGAQLGGSGYVRYREQEFSVKDVPKQELLFKIKETGAIVQSSLQKISDEDLSDEYPLLVFETKTTTAFLLVHLATHLTYHLGQINYHRRILGAE